MILLHFQHMCRSSAQIEISEQIVKVSLIYDIVRFLLFPGKYLPCTPSRRVPTVERLIAPLSPPTHPPARNTQLNWQYLHHYLAISTIFISCKKNS